jgi:Ca2+-transporting ATPase
LTGEDRRIYSLTPEEAAVSLGSNLETGLSEAEARKRLAEAGPNELRQAKATSPVVIFLGQFKDFIIWVLVGAAVVSGFMQEWVDALAIVAIVILNSILGFIQEYRAEKSLAALRKMASPTSKAIRAGRHEVIPAGDLVPGDLIELEAGDHIPADGRLVWLTSNFSTQEAALTGESTPVLKTIHPLGERQVPLADRANMAYTGTSVASGRARAMVTDTGMRTELGRIAGMIQEIQHESTPLQKKLEEFGKWIVYLCFGLVAAVFLLEWIRGGGIMEVFLTAVSLAVAAIPEGLPAVVTIALALGVQRMVRRHALIRKLPSVETLGCATVICSDKTGTLTKNEMTVQAMLAGGEVFRVTGIGYEPTGELLLDQAPVDLAEHPDISKVMQCAVLCNGAQLLRHPDGYRIFGDPTEAAMLTAAAKADLWKESLEAEFAFVDEIPFDSERKKMSVLRRKDGRLYSFVKGAPDVLVADCAWIEEDSAVRPLTGEDRERILAVNGEFADGAMRVLGLAYKVLEDAPGSYNAAVLEADLVFTGLMAMIDPPRPEVKHAVLQCQKAGIKTVMITGDHKNTAVAIARELGFFGPDSIALSGVELDSLADERLSRDIERMPVYARVSPEHKLRIVKAWRRKGHVVAMTGDGVNDAPAVKEADIGVAMGITGTDVTKEVSDMVVTDDNFASIVAAVEEGRGIYDNIKKFVQYLLSCNAGEILVMFTASLLGFPVPLLPVQILWVNLVTDGLPALALGVEPVDPGVMERPPRKKNEPVVTRKRAALMLIQGAFIAFCSLLAFCLVLFVEGEDIERARTAAFIVLACSQLFHAFNCRSMTRSIFELGLFTNYKLVLATGFSFLLQMSVVYLPFAQRVFKTQSLGLTDWAMVILISSFPLWAMEIFKLVARKTGRLDLLPA